MNRETKSPAGPGGANLKQNTSDSYVISAGEFLQISGDESAPDLSFARDAFADVCPTLRAFLSSNEWRRAAVWPSALPGARSLIARGVSEAPIFRVHSIGGRLRNLALLHGSRLHFLYAPFSWGDTIKIGRAYRGLIVAERLSDGLALRRAAGLGVLIVFGRQNLEAIAPDQIRRRWRGWIGFAPAPGESSEQTSMARRLRSDLLVPRTTASWSELEATKNAWAVRDEFMALAGSPIHPGGAHGS